jgi:hypothetical protein
VTAREPASDRLRGIARSDRRICVTDIHLGAVARSMEIILDVRGASRCRRAALTGLVRTRSACLAERRVLVS